MSLLQIIAVALLAVAYVEQSRDEGKLPQPQHLVLVAIVLLVGIEIFEGWPEIKAGFLDGLLRR